MKLSAISTVLVAICVLGSVGGCQPSVQPAPSSPKPVSIAVKLAPKAVGHVIKDPAKLAYERYKSWKAVYLLAREGFDPSDFGTHSVPNSEATYFPFGVADFVCQGIVVPTMTASENGGPFREIPASLTLRGYQLTEGRPRRLFSLRMSRSKSKSGSDVDLPAFFRKRGWEPNSLKDYQGVTWPDQPMTAVYYLEEREEKGHMVVATHGYAMYPDVELSWEDDRKNLNLHPEREGFPISKAEREFLAGRPIPPRKLYPGEVPGGPLLE